MFTRGDDFPLEDALVVATGGDDGATIAAEPDVGDVRCVSLVVFKSRALFHLFLVDESSSGLARELPLLLLPATAQKKLKAAVKKSGGGRSQTPLSTKKKCICDYQ